MDCSIIICTCNRSDLIEKCLDSVADAIEFAKGVTFEIVLVDNGSTDDTSACVRRWQANNRPDLILVYEGRLGLANARNAGLRCARGRLVVFTDDDCRMSPDYLLTAIKLDAMDTNPTVRGGSVYLGSEDDLPLTIKTDPTAIIWSRAKRSARHHNIGDLLLGCNMVMRRGVINRLGDFDNRFGAGSRIPGGEDTDYYFRAYLSGMDLSYSPELRVFHFHGRKRPEDGFKLQKNYSLGSGALIAKHSFHHIDFARPFYWDLKATIRSTLLRTDEFMPNIGFGYVRKVYYQVVGMVLFVLSKVSRNAG